MADHITLPKSTLLRFADTQYHKIAFYDVDAKSITEYKPKRYNTEMNYYPPAFEKWLSSEIETRIGRLHKDLVNFEKDREFEINYDELKKILVRIVAMQTFRMPFFLEEIMESTHRKAIIEEMTLDLLKAGRLNAAVIDIGRKYLKEVESEQSKRQALYTAKNAEKLIEIFARIFVDYTVNFAVVKADTAASFILTPSHYFINNNNSVDRPVFFLPLAPRYAFMLLPMELNDQYIDEVEIKGKAITIQRYITMTEENLIKLVPECINATKSFSKKHLISTKSFLSSLIESEVLPRREP